MYEPKQAPQCWFAKMIGAFKQCGFRQSYKDYSLFTYSASNIFFCLLIYVDDLIITGNNLEALQKFKAYLHTCFYMKYLGLLKYFLGIEVAQNDQEIYLCQRKYALNFFTDVGLLGVKLALFLWNKIISLAR